MPVIRIILLLVVLGGLTLLVVQNLSPVLPLVFLGLRSQALPLAVWILLSITAGALTSLSITGLFKLANYFAPSHASSVRNDVKASAPRSNTQTNKKQYTATNPAASTANSTPSNADEDDWGDDSTNDDWSFEEDTERSQNFDSQDNVKDSTTYEVKQQPKSSRQSGSVYSYSYREPKNSGVGKTESVYDADYRVITPPYREKDKPQDEDDWGFEDDEDENESSKKS